MQIVEVLIEYANRSLNRPFSYLYKGKAEMEKAKNYDFIILNDRIKRAGDEIISIIKKFDAE